MPALTGVTAYSIDGNYYSVVDALTYRTSSVKRESLTSRAGVDGYRETPQTGMIKAKLRLSEADTVSDFDDMVSVNVVAEESNGKTVSGFAMWIVESAEYDAMEATIEVTFEGPKVEVDL